MSLKEEGNRLFKEQKFKESAVAYTKALKEKEYESEQHLLYSNRSAAFLQMGRYNKALEDANQCIELKPDWPKGYFRKAKALEASKKLDDIKDVLLKGLALDCDSPELRNLLKKFYPSEELPLTTKQKAEREEQRKKKEMEEGDGEALGGGAVMSQEVVHWGRDIILEIQREFESSGTPDRKFRSQAYLLPPDPETPPPVIAIERAWLSPDTNIECVTFLRDFIAKENCKAALVIVQKSAMAYPQRWKAPSPAWTFSEEVDGLFIQMETPEVPGSSPLRIIHFLPISKEGKLSQDPHPLPIDQYAIFPPLFRGV